MATIELVLAVLKLANWLMTFINREQLKQVGKDELIAEQAMLLAQQVASKKVLQEKIDAMSEAEVNTALRDLEPR